LRIADQHGMRHIDKSDDWVRTEVCHGLTQGLRIVPLLVTGATLPEQGALPEAMRGLLDHQALEVRDATWEEDLGRLLERLDQIGFERLVQRIEFPVPVVRQKALDPLEIDAAVSRLRDWKVASSAIPGEPLKRQIEIITKYEFDSFEDAMHFMISATRHISKVNHHPRWENIWRTVTVALSTWDIGHKPSAYDIELAQYLDTLYANYVASDQGLIAHRPETTPSSATEPST
jgi:pterin-4a-carbinolamine dehydratase